MVFYLNAHLQNWVLTIIIFHLSKFHLQNVDILLCVYNTFFWDNYINNWSVKTEPCIIQKIALINKESNRNFPIFEGTGWQVCIVNLWIYGLTGMSSQFWRYQSTGMNFQYLKMWADRYEFSNFEGMGWQVWILNHWQIWRHYLDLFFLQRNIGLIFCNYFYEF